MADINIDLESNDRTELLGQGIRAYMMRDYNAAVYALSRASEIGVKEHNDDKHDSLAEIYLFYGKALLELSREESEPLGDAIPRETEDSDDEDDEEVDQEDNEVTEGDKMDVCDKDENKPKDKTELAEKASKEGENGEDKEPSSTQTEAQTTEEASSVKENEANASPKTGKAKADEVVTNGQADSTVDVQKTNGQSELKENGTSVDKDAARQNEVESEPCTSQENGEKTEETEEEPTDLQVAWEVLELAKIIYEKRGESSKKDLAETLITLGEVSMESENFDSAITDIKQGLEIQKTILENDSRKLAETYYKLGMALSTNNHIEEAIENFNQSLKILNNKIEKLKETDGDSKVQSEIEEIKSLIPEIEEKIADMKSFKEEAMKKLSITLEKQSGTKSEGSSSDAKKANDISHLVKRKRKLEEITEELEAIPSKKKTPEEKKVPEEVVSAVEEVKTSE